MGRFAISHSSGHDTCNASSVRVLPVASRLQRVESLFRRFVLAVGPLAHTSPTTFTIDWRIPLTVIVSPAGLNFGDSS